MARYFAERAVVDGRIVDDVRLDITDGRFAAVRSGGSAAGATRLPGLTMPGFANVHSHAFHRALRGRSCGGDFWAWRAEMYEIAARLDPESCHALARATYAEMVLAGYTSVGEFHYVHHAHGGRRYRDPNATSAAIVQAAADAGIRLTLLDACYLTGDIAAPLTGVQRRFGDGDAEAWAARVSDFKPDREDAKVGAAVHSIRAVPADQLPIVATWAAERGAPVHVHVSEQPAEIAACIDAYGTSPVATLRPVFGPRATAVHATHVSPGDIALLGRFGTTVCLCPTTERELADGIGRAGDLAAVGCRLAIGSDAQAVIDPFEEMRLLELHERLRTGRRDNLRCDALLRAATSHAALGWEDAGRIEPGALADFVTIDVQGLRLAGVGDPLWAATAGDVRTVVIGGREIVRDGRHRMIDDVAGDLRAAIRRMTE